MTQDPAPPTPLPAGTPAAPSDLRTFLIADVRGYTRFTQERGEAAAAHLAGHFATLIREGVEARGGHLLELRGDEALAVLGSVRQALHAALELQARCAEETAVDPTMPLAVGMGLEAGEALPVAAGYRGRALNLAARLCSLAEAGEVLVSEGVVHLAGPVAGLAYRERGRVQLKGLAELVRVLQVLPEDKVPLAPPPPLRGALAASTLPVPPTPFVVRQREVAAVCRLLQEGQVRLLTLVGAGAAAKRAWRCGSPRISRGCTPMEWPSWRWPRCAMPRW